MNGPTARSLEWARKQGWIAGVVERRGGMRPGMKFAKLHDLFGFADLVVVQPERLGTVYVQTTSASNHAAREAKILEEPRARLVLARANTIEVWSWGKRKVKRGGVAVRWTIRRTQLAFDYAHAAEFDRRTCPLRWVDA